jgi:hypothetical protein
VKSAADVLSVLALARDGLSVSAISRGTGVSRSQVRVWLAADEDDLVERHRSAGPCSAPCPLLQGVDEFSYAYLFGEYLGDGCLAEHPRGVQRLRLSTCDDYPVIRQECISAIQAVMPGRAINIVQCEGSSEVSCYSKHWVCLFPQHAPGRKHDRAIVLEPWQRQMVIERHARPFLRGLIHSDGCRSLNRIVRGTKSYAYPRYFFSNRSDDIRGLFLEACAALGVDARPNSWCSVSVARRESVARLDRFIGPKR